MNSFRSTTTPRFRQSFADLPPEIQEQAAKQYALFAENPLHRSLRLKQIGNIWSVRVSRSYRAVATREADLFTWFWIGPHDQYEEILKRMK